MNMTLSQPYEAWSLWISLGKNELLLYDSNVYWPFIGSVLTIGEGNIIIVEWYGTQGTHPHYSLDYLQLAAVRYTVYLVACCRGKIMAKLMDSALSLGKESLV